MNKKLAIFLQALLLLIVILTIYYFYNNVTTNLANNHIATGFGFLQNPTGFDIIMHLIPYSPSSTYLQAFVVGILNTILLSGLAIIFSTVFGVFIALARLSSNWLLAKLALCYVELFRNIPLLLQILFWYFVLLHYLPTFDQAWQLLPGLSLNVRGLNIGSYSVIPELIAMLLALTLYSTSYIAENIRAGILSVSSGQTEAAQSLGFKPWQITRFIIFPQALRVIVPPLTSQYLNITKNSSLSAVIGYPDLVAVFAGTALNQTGQAVETIFLVMSVYLTISLAIAAFMNWYNKTVLIPER